MKRRIFSIIALALSMTLSLSTYSAHAKSYIAYISDSSNSSVVYWIAKEAGIFKKHGLDFETIFIDGSVRGIQSLLAGDLGYTGAVGPAVINAKLAGGDIAIVQSQMNTLPYFIIGNAHIRMGMGRDGFINIVEETMETFSTGKIGNTGQAGFDTAIIGEFQTGLGNSA